MDIAAILAKMDAVNAILMRQLADEAEARDSVALAEAVAKLHPDRKPE